MPTMPNIVLVHGAWADGSGAPLSSGSKPMGFESLHRNFR